MKYLVVGDYRARPHEGMATVTTGLIDGLVRAGRDVVRLAPNRVAASLPWIVASRPDVVVFAHGPGPGVMLWSTILGRLTRARLVWLAPRPELEACPRLLKKLAKVDFVLASRLVPDVAAIVRRCGGEYVPTIHGIDFKRFRPSRPRPSPSERARILELGRLPPGPILLHVGHIRPNRGADVLIRLKRALGDQVELVFLGSPAYQPDAATLRSMKEGGIAVKAGYVEDLASCYRAADLYLWPATDEQGGAVDLPLTVLEALACDTPVLSTPFGSMPEVLGGRPGVRFVPAERFVSACSKLVASRNGLARVDQALPEEFDLALLHRKLIDHVEASPTR